MLRLENVFKRFGERLALDDLSVAVPPGQVVGLLGPNGSGKTTAMRIVFGVIDADAGVVRYRDRPLGAATRRRFGYMPEERGLYPRMRVHEHLVYLARLAGIGAADAAHRSRRLVEELGVADRADDRIEELSLGNQQRVQLAAALCTTRRCSCWTSPSPASTRSRSTPCRRRWRAAPPRAAPCSSRATSSTWSRASASRWP